MLTGAYVSVQFWRRGERSSLHHPVHWPSALRGHIREAMMGSRIYRQSRLRWSIFIFISMAFLALTAVFLLTIGVRFLLPAGNPFTDVAALVLDFLADLLGGVVTVGVLLAIFRRTLGREPHMKSDFADFAILLLLLGIVLTGFFLEACRLAVVAPEPRIWASFLGASFASLLRLWDLPWAAIRFYGWLLHAGLVFTFFAYLPFSKLFHVITSPISIAATASEAHYRQQQ
jgi:nitrate reductase gamma subunit